MNALGYLFAAYTIVWLALLAYLFFVSRGVGGLRQEVRALGDTLAETEREPAAHGASAAWRRPNTAERDSPGETARPPGARS